MDDAQSKTPFQCRYTIFGSVRLLHDSDKDYNGSVSCVTNKSDNLKKLVTLLKLKQFASLNKTALLNVPMGYFKTSGK